MQRVCTSRIGKKKKFDKNKTSSSKQALHIWDFWGETVRGSHSILLWKYAGNFIRVIFHK